MFRELAGEPHRHYFGRLHTYALTAVDCSSREAPTLPHSVFRIEIPEYGERGLKARTDLDSLVERISMIECPKSHFNFQGSTLGSEDEFEYLVGEAHGGATD